ncbi:MAG: hypothetical protein CM1200mP29_05380 [Verrucomicrobiota bacterium]|nr:MAG: hypothetical protein CM1200mP29_05380 [Verrucomicrobiota bacterium]
MVAYCSESSSPSVPLVLRRAPQILAAVVVTLNSGHPSMWILRSWIRARLHAGEIINKSLFNLRAFPGFWGAFWIMTDHTKMDSRPSSMMIVFPGAPLGSTRKMWRALGGFRSCL